MVSSARVVLDRLDEFSNRLIKLVLCSPTENGNPNNLPGLYSGSVAEFTKADTVIFRTDLYNMSTGQRVHPFKRTIKYDSKWLDSKFVMSTDVFLLILQLLLITHHLPFCSIKSEPNFVGSFDIGEFVYFFFRESAVEYINCGKNIYSRVARVCKVSALHSYWLLLIFVPFVLGYNSEIMAARIFSTKIGLPFWRLDLIVQYQESFHFILMKFVSTPNLCWNALWLGMGISFGSSFSWVQTRPSSAFELNRTSTSIPNITKD